MTNTENTKADLLRQAAWLRAKSQLAWESAQLDRAEARVLRGGYPAQANMLEDYAVESDAIADGFESRAVELERQAAAL